MTQVATSAALSSIFDSNNGLRNHKSSHASPIRACTNCVRAKARCSTSLSKDRKCDRCHRMSKNCQPSPPARKRRLPTKPVADKASKLEEKIDGLVTLLRTATQESPANLGVTPDSVPREALKGPNLDTDPGTVVASSIDDTDSTVPSSLDYEYGLYRSATNPASTSLSAVPSYRPYPTFPSPVEPNTQDAESYLRNFRAQFLKHLPFLVISPSITAHQLRQERPILWLCIMTVASSNSTQQMQLSREVRHVLGYQAFVEGTRNMDLLLAVLVYATWDRHHCFEKPVVTNLIQLATAILYDLGLDKPTSKDPALLFVYDLKGCKMPPRLLRSPTMEERRALLGCYAISSALSYLRKGESLRWTAYCDECLHVIESEKEEPSDVLLVQLIKLRLITAQTIELPWVESQGFTRPRWAFSLRSFQSQLNELTQRMPAEMEQNTTVLLELFNKKFSIYEIGFSPSSKNATGQGNQRTECLYSCLGAAKSCADTFLSIPPAEFIGFSALIYHCLARCFINMYRLSSYESPDWDCALARETLNPAAFLEEVEKKLLSIKEIVAFDASSSDTVDLFTLLASQLRKIRLSQLGVEPESRTANDMLCTPPSDETTDYNMPLLDDDWLNYLLDP